MRFKGYAERNTYFVCSGMKKDVPKFFIMLLGFGVAKCRQLVSLLLGKLSGSKQLLLFVFL